jgi:dTDP-4-dehydrorhamnose 3,5-epimerase
MEIIALDIPAVRLIELKKHGDDRGFIVETFLRRHFPDQDFVQDNLSFSAHPGTVRGLHFQVPPQAQAKLVAVLRGAIWDVAVDLRKGSPSFGRWVAAELRAEQFRQILVPRGFAHGFCTLEPDTLVLYKQDSYYSPAHERGLLWNDPALKIAWPVEPAKAILSDKDRRAPTLAASESPFLYAE